MIHKDIKTKYHVGEKVWKVTPQWGNMRLPCRFCGNTGEIQGKDGTFMSCPQCQHRDKVEYTPMQVEIMGVRIEQTTTGTRVHYNIPKTYLCPPEKLFKTLAEAQREADRLNKTEKMKEDKWREEGWR